LYYVATDDPSINIARIKNRVQLGGHPVSEEKIISRYHRSLSFLFDAIQYTNRAYIFDNSGIKHTWLAEITDGKTFDLKSDQMTLWFRKAVLDKKAHT
jgi:predicted ABC-type ATPase